MQEQPTSSISRRAFMKTSAVATNGSGLLGLTAAQALAEAQLPARTLQLPTKSPGALYIRTDSQSYSWELLCAANGSCAIPSGAEVKFEFERGFDLSMAGLNQLAADDVQYLDLTSCSINDEQIQTLASLGWLRGLSLARTQVTDRGLEVLADLPLLSSLDLSGLPVSTIGLAAIGRLQRLVSLDLSFSSVTGAAIQELHSLQSLEELHVSHTAFDLQHLSARTSFDNLRTLCASSTRISTNTLSRFTSMRNLTYLDLGNLKVSDSGVKALSDLPQLRWLNVDNNRITSLGLVPLERLQNLHNLVLGWSPYITDEVFDVVQKWPALKAIHICSPWIKLARVTRIGRILWLSSPPSNLSADPPASRSP